MPYPGLTSTDMTGNGAGHSPEEGARAAVASAMTHAYGPTGGFYACSEAGALQLKPWLGQEWSAPSNLWADGRA